MFYCVDFFLIFYVSVENCYGGLINILNILCVYVMFINRCGYSF